MKILVPKELDKDQIKPEHFFVRFANGINVEAANRKTIIQNAISITSVYDKYNYYPLIGEIFILLGYNCTVTRDGDTNNRSDAYLIDETDSIPIEIKSPTEIAYINNKSIRQSVENKIVLLSRKFYNTNRETTSLAIGSAYPAVRSGVFDLIEDVNMTFGFNIGAISLEDLLNCLWETIVDNNGFDKSRITRLKGKLI